ncbi:MAG: hypothetical protein JST92_05415 [Deltaproteobacteria bacterium]|nr:hypothetical protein [Deltaproteobacteria bacterium]
MLNAAPDRTKDTRPRGISVMGVILLLLIAGGVYWIIVFGGAYWENHEVKSVVHQAANIAYQQPSDAAIRDFIVKKTQEMFEYEYEEFGQRKKGYRIELHPEDIQIERNLVPPWIHISLTYTRIIQPPWGQQEKQLDFSIYVEQDLSPVKW